MFLILFLNANSSYSQFEVEGNVLNIDNEKIDYFTAALYNKNDTSLLVGGVFEQGYFKLTLKEPKKCLLEISSVGLLKIVKEVDFTVSNNYYFNEIKLNYIEIKEIIISAKRPIYSVEEGKMVMNVETTSLSESGNAIDVLKRAPGVIIDNSNNISVFSKGTPQIFINGREIQSKAELDILQSNDIKIVKIDKTPSSEFNASTKAVIFIETKKIKNDILNAEIYNRSYFARVYSNSTGININNKLGKFTNYLSYNFLNYNTENILNEYDINKQQTYTQYNITNKLNNNKSINNTILISNQYDIDSLKFIAIKYNYDNFNKRFIYNSNQYIYKTNTDTITRKINCNTSGIRESHNISSFYNNKFKNLNLLKLSLDYAKIIDNDNSKINENNLNFNSSNNSLITNNSYNNIFSLKSDLDINNVKYIETKIGVKFSTIKSYGITKTTDILNITKKVESNNINDAISAGYVDFSKKFKKLIFNFGLRTEYTNSNIILSDINIQDTNYIYFFPNLITEYDFTDNFITSLKYKKYINRPTFDELNPSYSYIDSLAYKIGNPLLKPTITNSFSLNFTILKLIFVSVEYKKNINERVFSAINDKINPDFLKYTTLNIPKSEHLVFDLSYNYSGKKLSSYPSTGIDFPFVNIPYMNNIRKVRKPIWYINFNNDYTLNEHFTFYCNLSFLSKGEDQITYLGRSFNASAGFFVKILKKRLQISIDLNDIFNTSDMTWEDNYGNIITGQKPDYDTRYLKLSIKYLINNFKTLFNENSSIDEEINRLSK